MIERQTLTSELAEIPPGPELAAALDRIDVTRLCGYGAVEVLKAQYRQCSHERARLLSAITEVGLAERGAETTRTPVSGEFAADEVRTALVLTRRAAEAQLDFAHGLTSRLPAVLAAMGEGRLDEPRARVLYEWTADLAEGQARGVCQRLLPEAQRLTTGQLIERVKKLAIAIDPDWARRRYERSLADRRVIGSRNPDGTANLSGLNLPTDRAAAAASRIEALAAAATRAGHPETVDHLRADLYLGLLDGSYADLDEAALLETLLAGVAADPGVHTGGAEAATDAPTEAPHRARPAVRDDGMQLRVRLSTLLGRDRFPGELVGWGPVHAELACHLAGDLSAGQWRFVITDEAGAPAHTGLLRARPPGTLARRTAGSVELQASAALLAELTADPTGTWATVITELVAHATEEAPNGAADASRRGPGAALRPYLQIRDTHCVGPGCRTPARSADVDHTRAHAHGGPTAELNLAHLCRHDHRLKHDGGWQLDQPASGQMVWTSRLGHSYPVDAPPILEHLPEPEPEPPPDPDPPPF
jgi:hypothetical protein